MGAALLIKTREGRFAVARLDMEASLVHFAESYGASIMKIETEAKPFSVREIVEKLNHPAQLLPRPPKHTCLEEIYSPKALETEKSSTVIAKENYREFLDQAAKVKEKIKQELINGNRISLSLVQEWAEKENIKLSKGGLSRHLQRALDWAVSKGYTRIKEGRFYRIEK